MKPLKGTLDALVLEMQVGSDPLQVLYPCLTPGPSLQHQCACLVLFVDRVPVVQDGLELAMILWVQLQLPKC